MEKATKTEAVKPRIAPGCPDASNTDDSGGTAGATERIVHGMNVWSVYQSLPIPSC